MPLSSFWGLSEDPTSSAGGIPPARAPARDESWPAAARPTSHSPAPLAAVPRGDRHPRLPPRRALQRTRQVRERINHVRFSTLHRAAGSTLHASPAHCDAERREGQERTMQGGREGIDRTRLNAGVWRSATAPHCKGRVSIVMLRAVLYCRQCRQAGWALCSGSWQRMVTTPRSDLSRHTTPLADKRKSQWPRCVWSDREVPPSPPPHHSSTRQQARIVSSSPRHSPSHHRRRGHL